MKRTLVVALATLTLASLTNIYAQQSASTAAAQVETSATTAAANVAKTTKAKGDPVARRTAYLKKNLKLSDAQTSQVKDILTQEHKDMAKLGKNATKAQKQQLNKQYREKINSVLTPDQQKTYKAMYSNAKKKAAAKAANSTTTTTTTTK